MRSARPTAGVFPTAGTAEQLLESGSPRRTDPSTSVKRKTDLSLSARMWRMWHSPNMYLDKPAIDALIGGP